MVTLLALDTATEGCSVAIQRGTESWHEDLISPREHTQQLLPMIERLLAQGQLSLQDLDAIAVTTGPGSFTGVRIGLSAAQGLAFGLAKPLIGLSTLATLAQTAYLRHGVTAVAAAIDARMHEIYWGQYQLNAQGLMTLQGQEALLKPHNAPQLSSPWVGAGSGFAAYPELAAQLSACYGDELPSARGLLTLGMAAYHHGHYSDPAVVDAIYLRDDVAQTTAQRAAALNASKE